MIDYDILKDQMLFEAPTVEYNKKVEPFELNILDVERYVKANEIREITNPVFFVKDNIPTEDGLLSNEIFGITKKERSGTFGYISLYDYFLDPSCYKALIRLDSKIKAIVHCTDKFIIDNDGQLVKSESGKTGLKFLRNNFDKLKFKSTGSGKRDLKIQYIERNRKNMWLKKYIVIPAAYRDVNTGSVNTGVGEINRLYSSLLISVRSLKETQDYGLSTEGSIHARIQECILSIYDWLAGNNNPYLKEEGVGLSKKKGIVKRSVMSKTADYASRLILSAPELKVESVDDLVVTLDKSAIPLAAICADYKPYMIFNVRRFFENEFSGKEYVIEPKSGNKLYVKNWLIDFSTEVIERELNRFAKGFGNRLVPVTINVLNEKGKEGIASLYFKGKKKELVNFDQGLEPITDRRLTWCDVFYMAAIESTRDKAVLITRFPMDSYYNQFPSKVEISTTEETEPMYIEGTYYPYYPRIREEDIGSNTGNMFIDTLQISNLHLGSIGGDYDGDQVTVKGAYFVESNEELFNYLNSKAFFIGLGNTNVRNSSNESIQAIYNLTKVLSDTKLTNPVF